MAVAGPSLGYRTGTPERPASAPMANTKVKANKPTKVDKDRLKEILQQTVSRRQRYKFRFELQWLKNIAMLLGYHYATINYSERKLQLYGPPLAHWRVRSVTNLILPKYRVGFAKMAQSFPQAYVRPAPTGEQDDFQSANISQLYLRFMEEQYDWEQTVWMELAKWVLVCGHGYLEARWNKDAGPPSIPTESGEARSRGDSEIIVHSPFMGWADPAGADLKDAEWFLKSFRKTPWWVKRHFNYDGELKAERPSMNQELLTRLVASLGQLDQTTDDLLSGSSAEYSMHADTAQNDPGAQDGRLTLHILEHRPTEEFPRGFITALANDKIIHVKDELENAGEREFSVIEAKFTDIPGRTQGLGIVEPNISPQKTLNRLNNQLIERGNQEAGSKWWIPEQCGDVSITGNPSENVRYTAVGDNFRIKPEPVQYPTFQVDRMGLMTMTANYMESISGIHKISEGGDISHMSGRAYNVLREQDDTDLFPSLKSMYTAYAKACSRCLRLFKKHGPAERMILIAGRSEQYSVMNFMKSKLTFDVRVNVGASMPRTRNESLETVSVLLQHGGLNPTENPEDRELLMNVMRFSDVYSQLKEKNIDMDTADAENEAFMVGEYIQPQEWEHHPKHIARHNLFRKTSRFRKAPAQVQQRTAVHIQLHETWIQYKMIEQQTKMMGIQNMATAMAGGPAMTPEGASGIPMGPQGPGGPGGPGGAPAPGPTTPPPGSGPPTSQEQSEASLAQAGTAGG